MSKKESALSVIWKNKEKILEGLKNRVFVKESVEVIAEQRLAICKGCELFDSAGDLCMMPGTQPCCGECGCSLALKTRSLSSECGEKKWDAVLTAEEEVNHDNLNPENDA